ncbi:hypothetical protein [Actinoplanes regularis]|uniref:Uncharacterized protein n=1 Tax=Actinoplanes regularis TaxID=52697 RepID=A0A239HSU9_9ACTN|nr:hypothetical protein [Actinoplanes regularis]GIE91196.1 hypothetical protein Are01nite_76760 [Actinoplanes regularis]SNS84370.1 hypothetical protein SAMN06264365_1268 [Actinoplanes regularis]
MADISWARRMDAITGGAIVLTVDAVVFLMTALVGAPFVLFFLSSGDDPLGPLWPLATVWVVSAVLGSAAAAAAFLIGARNTQRIRQAGAVTALAAAAATVTLVATSISESPVLAAVSALFAAANLGGAKLLATPEPAGAEAPPALPDAFLLAAPLAEAEVRTRETIELQVRPQPTPSDEPSEESSDELSQEPAQELPEKLSREVLEAPAEELPEKPAQEPSDEPRLEHSPVPVLPRPRRPRGPAATRTLAGIQLPPRARRTHPSRG